MDLQNDLLSLQTDFSWQKELDFQYKSNQISTTVLNNYLKKQLEDSYQINTKYYNLNQSENQLEEYLIKFGVQRLLKDFSSDKKLIESPLEEREFDLQQLYEEDNMSTNECSAELLNLKNYEQQQQNINNEDLNLEKQETQKIGEEEMIQEVEENEESEDYEDSEYSSECQQQYQKQTPQQYQQEINQQLNQQEQEQQLNNNQSSYLEEEQSQSENNNQTQHIQQNQNNQNQIFDDESETLQSEEMATTTLNFNSISCNPASSTDSILQQQLAINQQNYQQESSEQQQQFSSQLQISSSPQYEDSSSSEYVPQNQKILRRSQRQTQKKVYQKKEKLQKPQKKEANKLSQKKEEVQISKIQNKTIKKRDITLNYKNKRSSEETKNLPTTIGKILLKSLKEHLPDIKELQEMEAISNKDHFQQLFKISPVVQRYSIDFLTKGPMMAYLASSTRLKQKRLVIKYIDIIVEGAIDPYNFKCFKQQPTY